MAIAEPRAQRTYTAALAGATVAVSFSAIFIRIAGDDAATIVWLRMGLAVVLLAPFALRELRRGAFAITRSRLGLTSASGALLAGHFLLWTASLRYTSIAASVLLVSLHPLIVTPLSRRVAGDPVRASTVVGMVLALLGTVVTCAGDLRLDAAALFGDLLAIGGAVCLAGYLLIGRSVRANAGVAAYSGTVYAVVCVIAAAVAIGAGGAHMPTPRVALLCLALAAVCTIAGHTVYNWALRHVAAATVSVAFLGEPPLTAVLGLAILGNVPSPATVAGGVLILAGLGLALSSAADAVPATS